MAGFCFPFPSFNAVLRSLLIGAPTFLQASFVPKLAHSLSEPAPQVPCVALLKSF